MIKDLVSIITPCYNGEKYLKKYFNSILEQTYPYIELIFINDGSTDNTENIVDEYIPLLEKKGIKTTIISQNNLGQAAALNKGLEIFEGEFLIWPDSDDQLTSNSIKEKVEFLKKNPGYDMVRSNGIYYNVTTRQKRKISNSENDFKEDIFEDLLLLKTYGCCGCYMIKSSLFKKIYPNKKIFESKYGQNWQILVPAASRTKCGYIDKELYIVTEHEDSHSRNSKISVFDRWDGFTEILENCIEHSVCDKQKMVKKVRRNNARQQFYYAIETQDKYIINQKFNKLKREGKVSLKEYMLYFKCYILKR